MITSILMTLSFYSCVGGLQGSIFAEVKLRAGPRATLAEQGSSGRRGGGDSRPYGDFGCRFGLRVQGFRGLGF